MKGAVGDAHRRLPEPVATGLDEAQLRIQTRRALEEDQVESAPRGFVQPCTHQRRADALALDAGSHGERAEHENVSKPVEGVEKSSCESDVPESSIGRCGDQLKAASGIPELAQLYDQVGHGVT